MSVNNQVKLIGRLTADPVYDNGKCKFTIAVNEGIDRVTFVPCVAYKDLAEDLGNTCKKGTKVEVTEGSLSIRPYTGEDGIKRKWASVNVWEASIVTKSGMSEAGKFGDDEEIPF